jgi:N-alpha-acetyltransferase 35, NatC auxiliary subunit
MAWHKGHPLSQTIFTSLYVDRLLSPTPLSLDQTFFDRSESCLEDEPLTLRILRAYCLGLIKTCWFVNNRVKSEHYYEVRMYCCCVKACLTLFNRKKIS